MLVQSQCHYVKDLLIDTALFSNFSNQFSLIHMGHCSPYVAYLTPTRTGVLLFEIDPSPSWPLLFSPHAQTVPSDPRARL